MTVKLVLSDYEADAIRDLLTEEMARKVGKETPHSELQHKAFASILARVESAMGVKHGG